MTGTDQSPGRRRAVAPVAPRLPKGSRGSSRSLASGLWLLITAAGITATGLAWSPIPTPSWLPVVGAVTISTTLTFGLAVRTGGRPALSGVLALALATGAVMSGRPSLVAGAALGTAVVASVLAVMATKPAAGFPGVVRECLVAVAVGMIGAFSVEAYQPRVSTERFGYLCMGLALLASMALVYRLGAGLHGLGRRGFVMVVSGLTLLAVSIAYTEALSRWGSPGFAASIKQVGDATRSLAGGVPHPVEYLVGIPALAWGVSTRARRRQGWWVCAFGAAGIAGITSSLLGPRVALTEAGLSGLYGLVIGLVVGYLVIRADKFLTGPRGRRARQLEEASAHRPEPGRMQSLL